MHLRDSRLAQTDSTMLYIMETRPTVLYPEHASFDRSQDVTLDSLPSDSPTSSATLSSPIEGLDPSSMRVEDHLLALRDGMDYLSGVLQLLDEHLQNDNRGRRGHGVAAVAHQGVERTRVLQRHLDALTEDFLARMREGSHD